MVECMKNVYLCSETVPCYLLSKCLIVLQSVCYLCCETVPCYLLSECLIALQNVCVLDRHYTCLSLSPEICWPNVTVLCCHMLLTCQSVSVSWLVS